MSLRFLAAAASILLALSVAGAPDVDRFAPQLPQGAQWAAPGSDAPAVAEKREWNRMVSTVQASLNEPS